MEAVGARGRDPTVRTAVRLALALPRDPVTVAWVRTVTGDVLRQLRVMSSCVDDVQLVLSEACGNAVKYGRGDRDYEVQLAVDGPNCLLEVRNWGPPLAPDALNHGMPPPDALGGRGIAMMRHMTDELTVRSDAEVGTVVVRMTMVLQVETDESVEPDGRGPTSPRPYGPAGLAGPDGANPPQ